MKKLHRSNADKIIWGVCGGLGEYFQIDSVIIRILFVLMLFAGGTGFFLYIVLAIMMPSSLKENDIIEERKEEKSKLKMFLGILLALVGLCIMLNIIFGFNIFSFVDWRVILSLFLILIGLKIIFENEKQ
ncbi:MAG: PspC domain-containing protein [Candidatus Pacebacteria bacterium]|nr:PspC domain-containing protein [Candidatus Paceibacterota bacterium]MDD2757037.1 PspC domain-containing protein [Candidatus Paceibacterota bacterium]MDD3283546.1 PspC domain-containing protein [Candidatus Paceibacterota bacterium]MDD3969597.1 PspC domain-containing protein [Candidatus Paceibacterota bacterium]MDD4737857.1 PspC domain-containing protein [Candidatus Paceibacterota bacterium]